MSHSNLYSNLVSIHHRISYLESLVHLDTKTAQVKFYDNLRVSQFRRFMQREWRYQLNPVFDELSGVWDDATCTALSERTRQLYHRHIEVFKPQYGDEFIEEIYLTIELFIYYVFLKDKQRARSSFKEIMQYVSPPTPSFSSG